MVDPIKELYYKTLDENYKNNNKHYISSSVVDEFYTQIYSKLRTNKQQEIFLNFIDKIEDMQAEIFAMGFRVGLKITKEMVNEDI